ncbi:MAG: SMP-30/gluconolactonase/LRE family protein [Pseudomonadota bacterium]
MAHESGLLFAADWTGPGGVAIVDTKDGTVRRHLASIDGPGIKPNGILLEADGSFLLTHLDSTAGGVFRLQPDGRVDPVLLQVNGYALPPTNFAARDAEGRLYITVSTRQIPRHQAANARVRDGFIVLLPPDGEPKIVADGIGYTNECLLSPDGRQLFVNETFGRQTSVYSVRTDGSLGDPEVFAQYGEGVFPDGLAFDEEGHLWVVSIISNTVLRCAPDGRSAVIMDDRDEARVGAVEAAYLAARLTRELLDAPHAGPLKNVSSIAFGGADGMSAYLGCLLGDSIAHFRTTVPGLRPPHFDVSLAPLQEAGVLSHPSIEA